ncbi:unnamed protein product [Prorocentrum cordatum]|uniref:Uncharacterized protein n=1 Tax=Prorocentrum cordatum TaxID=2364126 RepID=A0ABN9QA35_9DINO|nr:unnamed protein product [Polarella glacialis]
MQGFRRGVASAVEVEEDGEGAQLWDWRHHRAGRQLSCQGGGVGGGGEDPSGEARGAAPEAIASTASGAGPAAGDPGHGRLPRVAVECGATVPAARQVDDDRGVVAEIGQAPVPLAGRSSSGPGPHREDGQREPEQQCQKEKEEQKAAKELLLIGAAGGRLSVNTYEVNSEEGRPRDDDLLDGCGYEVAKQLEIIPCFPAVVVWEQIYKENAAAFDKTEKAVAVRSHSNRVEWFDLTYGGEEAKSEGQDGQLQAWCEEGAVQRSGDLQTDLEYTVKVSNRFKALSYTGKSSGTNVAATTCCSAKSRELASPCVSLVCKLLDVSGASSEIMDDGAETRDELNGFRMKKKSKARGKQVAQRSAATRGPAQVSLSKDGAKKSSLAAFFKDFQGTAAAHETLNDFLDSASSVNGGCLDADARALQGSDSALP